MTEDIAEISPGVLVDETMAEALEAEGMVIYDCRSFAAITDERLEALEKRKVVDKTGRRKIEDQQKAIENLSTKLDDQQASFGRLWARQRNILRRLRATEQMLGITSPDELVSIPE